MPCDDLYCPLSLRCNSGDWMAALDYGVMIQSSKAVYEIPATTLNVQPKAEIEEIFNILAKTTVRSNLAAIIPCPLRLLHALS